MAEMQNEKHLCDARSMIESAIKVELANELKSINGQENQQVDEGGRDRVNALKQEVKSLISEARSIKDGLEKEPKGLESISNAQKNNGIRNSNISKACISLNERLNSLTLSHEKVFKDLEKSTDTLSTSICNTVIPDENCKLAKKLLIEAENKLMLMTGKRDVTRMTEADIVSALKEVNELEKEYRQICAE